MDDDKSRKARDKIAKLVSTHGVSVDTNHKPDSEKKASMQKNATGGIQITAETLHLSNVNFHTGLDGKPVIMPEVKSIEKMDEEEKKAYQSGEWDGITRRIEDKETDEYFEKIKIIAKRKKDIKINTVHYSLVFLCFFFLFGSFALSLILKGYTE